MTDDAKRPDLEPEIDEPVFTSDDATPEQSGPGRVQDADSGQAWESDANRPAREHHPEGEPAFGEPVFSPDDHGLGPAEPAFSTDPDPDSQDELRTAMSGSREPAFGPDSDAIQEADFRPVPDAGEPPFGSDSEQTLPSPDPMLQGQPEETGEPSPAEAPGFEEVSDQEPSFESALEASPEDETAAEDEAIGQAGWVNISADSGMSVEPLPEKEYTLFDETPAADVAMTPPPRRKLGRTGPVWVIGGIVLVVIVGLVWLAISRLTGGSQEVPVTAAEPTVQQVEEASPTPEPATPTIEAEPEPTRVRLPVLSNVKVGETGGEGVMLRADPNLNGGFIAVIPEGEAAVVLEPKPEDGQYPVDADGHLWYRVRVPGLLDAEGVPLAGWSASDFFVTDEQ